MTKNKERRRWKRESPERPEIGIIYPDLEEKVLDDATESKEDSLLVYVLNRSQGGLLLESSFPFKVGSSLNMRVKFPHDKSWLAFEGKVVWADTSPDQQSFYRLGVELHRSETADEAMARVEGVWRKRMFPSDLEFLTQTEIFENRLLNLSR